MTSRCPRCKKNSEKQFRPFCSKFCKDKDLLNWLNENYSVPVISLTSFEEEETQAEEPNTKDPHKD